MSFIKHRPCDTDVIVKRVKSIGEEHALIKIWCPTCERVVKEPELSRRGPYSVFIGDDAIVV